MIITLKRKYFGFLDRLKGNPELVNSYNRWEYSGSILPEIERDPLFKKLPNELKKHVSWLYINLNNDELLGKITFVSYGNVEKQLKGKGYNTTSFRQENRIILAWAARNNCIIIAYYPEENVIKVTDEAFRFDLINRSVNNLLPGYSKTYSPEDLFELLKNIRIR